MLPALPGAPLIFLGIVGVAWADDFTRIGLPGLLVTGAIAVVISIVDYTAGILGAKRFGASYWGLAGAFVGLVVGLFFGFPGIVLGPVVGAVLLEYLKDPDVKRAAKIGTGTLIGFVVGTAVKYALAFALLGTGILFYLF